MEEIIIQFRWLAEATFDAPPERLGDTVDLYLACGDETNLLNLHFLGSVVVASVLGPHVGRGALDFPKPHRIIIDAKQKVKVTICMEEVETYQVKTDLSPEILDELEGEDLSHLLAYSLAQRVIGVENLVGEPWTRK